MLEELKLENFRGFDTHLVPFKEVTVVVGANNAGKSTIVEALRLVAMIVTRARRGSAQLVPSPEWLQDPRGYRGIQPARRGRGFEGAGPTVFYRYGAPPAVITASFTGGLSTEVFIGPAGDIHGVLRGSDGHAVGSANEAKGLGLPALAVQPQVTPLLREERILTEQTVRRGEGTYLAPQHFRNQLIQFSEHYKSFREIAEQSWAGLQIKRLEYDMYRPDDPIQLDIRDNDFVGEVSLMGHGLQMWLQTMWFLARTEAAATVVLDEPDVYMHPDLQRRLLTLVRDRFGQLVVATHSVDLMSDVDPRSILSIDRRQPHSSFVTDLPGVQDIIDKLGGVHNIQVTRLFRSKTFLFVEGKDLKLLRILQRAMDPNADPIDLLPNGDLGGRGGWLSGLPRKLPPKNAAGEKITTYCVLDRDYFPKEEIDDRYAEAKQWGVRLRVWAKKELENYLLVPSAVNRFIMDKQSPGRPASSVKAIEKEIDRVVDAMRDSPISDGVASEYFARNKKRGIASANRAARKLVASAWKSRDARWSMAPGKEVLSRLSDWSKAEYGVSFGPAQIARAMTPAEVDPEVAGVIRAVVAGRPMPKK